jgi:hypothetical protein
MEKPAAFPQTLEIETTDFHIPSAPATIANIDIQKPKGAFPSLPTVLLQAHPSIGKDYEKQQNAFTAHQFIILINIDSHHRIYLARQ